MALHAASSVASIVDIRASPSVLSLQAIAPQLECQATFHNRMPRERRILEIVKGIILDMNEAKYRLVSAFGSKSENYTPMVRYICSSRGSINQESESRKVQVDPTVSPQVVQVLLFFWPQTHLFSQFSVG